MKHLLTINIILISITAYAQNFSLFPEDIIVRNTMIPSLADYLESPKKQNFKISSFVKQRTGLFKEVRSAQMNGQYSFKNTNIGIQMVANKKGEFIRRNRFYINYAVHIPLNQKGIIAVGISAGIINYSILSNTGGPSGSDIKPDGSIGLAYYNKKNTINITLNQLPEPRLSPFYEETILPRFAQALYLRNFIIRKHIWTGHYYGRADVYSNNYNQFSTGVKLLYQEQVSLGVSFNSDGEFFSCMGFKYDWNMGIVSDMYLGYQVQSSLFEHRYNSSSFQIGLIIYKKSDNHSITRL